MESILNVSVEVHEQDLGIPAADIQANTINPVMRKGERGRGLAHFALLRLTLFEQAFLNKLAHDHGNGLRRQAGKARQFAAGHFAISLNHRKEQALIMVSQALLASPAAERSDF